ncbi:FAD-binding oxidoreductase [Pseudomonas sp. B21-056]|jgi:hypothetical protein|uniref:FAD-dependent oxidoreductase n=1 Tax=Pseudomonas sp. B21-056 TaxID=2895495 RepID=UPI002232805E|nr:FAD-dependent oxidoreductase [Pseudomonas sp. B21-056]UZE24781.1 FAD-binding oxidoreductase [Pseudomonas sp. B21-056]
MERRKFLQAGGLILVANVLSACGGGRFIATERTQARYGSNHFSLPAPIAPIRASPDRIIAVGVGIRPFRAQGPRIESERLGSKTLIHNYGHGGSGWSLSWGAAALAVAQAKMTGRRTLAVIGCGAIGLTTAVLALRSGFSVRIYTKDLMPQTHSFQASGVWTPDSRICAIEQATPQFKRSWEMMARTSFSHFQTLVGLPGDPIKWHDGYSLANTQIPAPADEHKDSEPEYADLRPLIRDLLPVPVALRPQEHPFAQEARFYRQMGLNINAYSRLLLDDYLRGGGKMELRQFYDPGEFSGLPEDIIVNATGYGARALLGDESIIAVRGQTARLIPQPEVTYGISYRGENLFVAPRGDGILVQAHAKGDFGNPDTTPDPIVSEAAVRRLAALFPS